MTKKCHWNTKIRVYEAGVTSKTHTSHLECVYVQVYLLFRLQSERSKFHHWKWITNFRVFILFSLDKLQWNKKNLFSRSIQMSILANSKWAGHKSSKCKLKMCYKTKKKCKSYLWPLLLLQPSYPSCKYNWNAATSKQNKQHSTFQDYM